LRHDHVEMIIAFIVFIGGNKVVTSKIQCAMNLHISM
jgi:hypothetical protein